MDSSFKAGLGETIITPDENLQLRGFARSQVATGTHDDLHARTLVVEDGEGTSAVLMALSLVYIQRELIERIRAGVNEKTGIPENNILISCTHTHSGPYIEEVGEKYQNFATERSIESAVEAWENRVPVRLGIASTEVMELGRNRRRLLHGGIHPDPEVALIKIGDTNGKLMGVAFNYGCHPSALDWQNRLYSEDWPYYAIQGIKNKLGKDIWAAYYQSCEGDINVGYSSELSAVGVDMPVRSYWYIEIKGKQMSDAVLAALPDIETSQEHRIRTATDFFDFPLRESLPFTLEEAEQRVKETEAKLAEMEKAPEYKGTRLHDHARLDVFSANQRRDTADKFYNTKDRPTTEQIELQAIRIGDAVFVSVPGEVFSEIGLQIKKQSPFEKTYVIGVTNGFYGYMPTAREFIEGDYEVDGCKYSPKAGQVCIESCLDLIRRVS